MNQANAIETIPNFNLEGGDLFAAWRSGHCTQDEWIMFEAIRFADTADTIRPKPYQPMQQAIRAYCEGRIAGNLDYDYALAKRLGDWFYALGQVVDANQEMRGAIQWAIEKLDGKLAGHVDALRAALKRMEIPFPGKDYDLTLLTKKIDAAARIK
jgi:hypothetical protein